MQIDLIPLLTLILGAGGVGAFFGKIVDGILKIAGGVSVRESKRRVDIVLQRDEAYAAARKAWEIVDDEAAKRRAVQEESARLRRLLILNGIDPGAELEFEKTITQEQLEQLRNPERT